MYQRIKPRAYRPVKPVVRTIEDLMDKANDLSNQRDSIAYILKRASQEGKYPCKN